jgi:cellulose synthase/poly-beta-1,6-N-acetylglucosamine synthase-like glycosyltransferase
MLLFLSLVCFTVFLYPFVIYPFLLTLLRKQPLCIPQENYNPSFTLVFCAYNEENALPEKIDNIRLLKARYSDLEVLGYSDMSQDNTLNLLQEAEAEGLLTAIPATERLGKAWGMRQLVARANGDIIIFTDANVSLAPESIDRLKVYFSDPKIGTVAGQLHYLNQGDSATADVGNHYWTLEERIKALESETGSTMGADGAIFARRRIDYPNVPPHLLDDLTASISPLFDGYRVISAPDVIAYERLTTDSGDEYRRKRRIACRAFNTHRYLTPRLRTMSTMNRYKYISHKLLRWFSPFFLALSGVFAMAGLINITGVAGLFIIVACTLTTYFLWRKKHSKVQKIVEIGLALLATGHGVLESFQGKTYQTWAPAQSRNT